MAKLGDGKDQVFKKGSYTVPAGHLTNVEWPRSRDEIELTGAEQDDKEFIPSERSSTITVNMWDDAADAIRAEFENNTAAATVEWYRQGNTTGKPKRSASAFVTNISDPLPHNQGAALTVTLRVTGAVTQSTVA
jgi:hypothetical protein